MEEKHTSESIGNRGREKNGINLNKNYFREQFRSHKYLIIAFGLISIICSLFLLLSHTTKYEATALICPKVQQKVVEYLDSSNGETVLVRKRLADLPIGAYPGILRSPKIQQEVLRNSYKINHKYGKYHINLMEYFALKDIAYAFGKLDDITKIEVNENQTLLKLSVKTKYPELSRQIVDRYLKSLQDYISQSLDDKQITAWNDLAANFDYVYDRSSDQYKIQMENIITSDDNHSTEDVSEQGSSFIVVNDGSTLLHSAKTARSLALIALLVGITGMVSVYVTVRMRNAERQSAEIRHASDIEGSSKWQYRLEIPDIKPVDSRKGMKFKAVTLTRGPESLEETSARKKVSEEEENKKPRPQISKTKNDVRPDLELARIYELGDLSNTVEKPDRLNRELLEIVNQVEPGIENEPENAEDNIDSLQLPELEEEPVNPKRKTVKAKQASSTAKSVKKKSKSPEKSKSSVNKAKTSKTKSSSAKKTATKTTTSKKSKTRSSKSKSTKKAKVTV